MWEVRKNTFADNDGRHARGRDHLNYLAEQFDQEYERLGISEIGGDRHKRERRIFGSCCENSRRDD